MGELHSPEPFGDRIKRLAHLLYSFPLLMLPVKKLRSNWLLEGCSASSASHRSGFPAGC